jgi:hypothetical protein
MAERNNLIETNDPKNKVASVAFKCGDWVMKSTQYVTPAKPGNPIIGLCLEDITSASTNYALNSMIAVDGVSVDVDRFLMPVTGTATAAMENGLYDVDPTDASKLSVNTYSTIVFGKVNSTAFLVGDTVTGGTSSSTGVISGFSADRMVITSPSGAFVADETITGTGGGTAKVLTYATGGSQFEITQFIDDSLVEVKVKLVG